MKHYLSTLILLIFFQISMGQLPEGKLFIYTNDGTDSAANKIGYYQLSSQTYTQIDTVSTSDLTVKGDRLFSASGYHFTKKIPTYTYDLQTGQKLDTIQGLYAKKLDFWGEYLVSINDSLPYFSVRGSLAPYNQLFSLDSGYFSHPPTDLLISQDRAYLLYPTEIRIVNLKTQDTLPSIPIYHPYGFGSGANTYFNLIGSKIYIMVDYATGAIRSSLMSLATDTYKVDTVIHVEGHGGLYNPISGDDRLFMYGYKSYFDFVDDSLYIDNVPFPFSFSYMIDHDAGTFTDFVWPESKDSIEIYQADSLVLKLDPPGNLLNALFVKDTSSSSTGLTELLFKTKIQIFPNPASSNVTLRFDSPEYIKGIQIYDLSGRIVDKWEINALGKIYEISLPKLAKAYYFLKVDTRSGLFIEKIRVR